MNRKMLIVTLFLIANIKLAWCVCEEDSPELKHIIANKLNYSYHKFIYQGNIDDCNCVNETCFKKCCAESYVLDDNVCMYNDSLVSFSVYQDKRLIDDEFVRRRIIVGLPNCSNGIYQLEPDVMPEDEFYLQKDGRLWLPNDNIFISLDSHCLKSTSGNLHALVCVPIFTEPEKIINIAGMFISMPFLLATFIIYALLPQKNIHGKSLMCYVFALLLAYILLIKVNDQLMSRTVCFITCLTCLYSFTASFFWMNVMSIDIWLTFSGSRDFSGNTKANARKQFQWYNLYAWGVPFVLVLLVGLLNEFGDQTSWYNPKIGAGHCWIEGSLLQLMYFYAPLALIIVINLALFGVTALKIRKLQKDTAMLRSAQFKKHSEEERKRFQLYIKLSLAMGVNWIMEIVSFAVDWQVGSVPRPVWYLTDLCNAMYGVIIFFIFVCKKKIWITLKTRYPCYKKCMKSTEAPCNTVEYTM